LGDVITAGALEGVGKAVVDRFFLVHNCYFDNLNINASSMIIRKDDRIEKKISNNPSLKFCNSIRPH
jgi:hypothetical protein